MDPYLISVVALACALPLVWWLARRQDPKARVEQQVERDRIDTLIGWPPEPTRILRSSERLAFSTLKLALPGYLILAQVPVARFIAVPKRYSFAEWMRRIGHQCVDFAVCDVTSQVVAVVEVRPPSEQIDERVRARFDRMARTLKAAKIPLHIWNEEKLPTIEQARDKILPNAPAVPPQVVKRPMPAAAALSPKLGPRLATATAASTAAATVAAMVEETVPELPDADPFADTDRDWSQGEIIEVREPSTQSWFDELDSVTAELPALPQR